MGRRKGEDTLAAKRRRMPFVAKMKREDPFHAEDSREIEAMCRRSRRRQNGCRCLAGRKTPASRCSTSRPGPRPAPCSIGSTAAASPAGRCPSSADARIHPHVDWQQAPVLHQPAASAVPTRHRRANRRRTSYRSPTPPARARCAGDVERRSWLGHQLAVPTAAAVRVVRAVRRSAARAALTFSFTGFFSNRIRGAPRLGPDSVSAGFELPACAARSHRCSLAPPPAAVPTHG